MARPKNETGALMAALSARLQSLVDVAKKEGREAALAEVRAIVGGNALGGGRRRGRPPASAAAAPAAPTHRRRRSRKPRKNPWATMTPEQRAERVRRMLAGRGLKPKSER